MVVARSGTTFEKQQARGREDIHAASVLSRLAGGSLESARRVQVFATRFRPFFEFLAGIQFSWLGRRGTARGTVVECNRGRISVISRRSPCDYLAV